MGVSAPGRRSLPVLVAAVLVVEVPIAAPARGPGAQLVPLQQGDDARLGAQRVKHALKLGFKLGTDPDDQVGALQPAGVRGAQAARVGRGRSAHQEMRRADALHHAGNQGMERLDRDHDLGHRQRRRRASEGGPKGEAKSSSGPGARPQRAGYEAEQVCYNIPKHRRSIANFVLL